MSIARFQITKNIQNKWDLEIIEGGSISNCSDIESKETAIDIAQAYFYEEYGYDILFDVVRSTRTHIIYDVYSKASCKSA